MAAYLKSIGITNLGPFEGAVFDLEPVTFIGGDIGAGKSTLVDALLFALTNRTLTYPAMKDRARLVRDGTDKATVRVTLAPSGLAGATDSVVLERTLSASNQVGARLVTTDAKPKILVRNQADTLAATLDHLGITNGKPVEVRVESLAAALSTSHLFSMKPDARAKLLGSILGTGGPASLILAVKEWVREHHDLELDGDIGNSLLDWSGDLAEAAKKAKASADSAGTTAGQPPELLPKDWVDPVTSRSWHLAGLGFEPGDHIREATKKQAALDVELAKIRSFTPELARVQSELEAAEKARGEASATPEAAEMPNLEQKRATRGALKDEHQSLALVEAGEREAIEVPAVPDLDSFRCSKCGHDNKDTLEAMREAREAALAQRLELSERNTKRSAERAEVIAALDGEIRELVTAHKAADALSTAYTKAQQRIETATAELQRVEADKAAARKLEEVEAEHATARAEEEAALRLAAAFEEFDRSARNRAAWEKASASALARKAQWAAVAKALAPSAVPAELASGHMEGLAHELREASRWSGFSLALTPSLEPRVNGQDVRRLSEGQALIAQVGFQVALCKLVGCPLLLVDRLNVTGRSKDLLVAGVSEAVKGGHVAQALLLSTLGDREPSAPPAGSGLGLYILDKGAAERRAA